MQQNRLNYVTDFEAVQWMVIRQSLLFTYLLTYLFLYLLLKRHFSCLLCHHHHHHHHYHHHPRISWRHKSQTKLKSRAFVVEETYRDGMNKWNLCITQVRMERWPERYLLRCSDEDIIIIIIIIISSTFAVDDNDMHAFNGREST